MLPTPVCAGYTVDELVVGYRAEGRLPALAELPRVFTARETGHYAAAGSLVRYVRGRWGMDGVRGLWNHGMRGTRAALGIPLDELEREWLDSLRGTPVRRIDWQRIRRYGCEAP
jgi:hypothetical protein